MDRTVIDTTGDAPLEALQRLVRCGRLDRMRGPLSNLIQVLDLSGFKFCIAAPDGDRFRILAVMSGGTLASATDSFPGSSLGPSDPILWESYRTAHPVSWTPYFTDPALMEASQVDRMAAYGVTCGASVPILSRGESRRASLCVSGRPGEAPDALDLRLPAFWPILRLAGLAMLEAGAEKADATLQNDSPLSRSEIAVLSGLSEGLRLKEVATRLGKSERTIRNQLESARKRLGAQTSTQAVVRWRSGCCDIGHLERHQ